MYVSIPSFKDESVIWSVRSCVERAARPEQLVVAVCEQNERERSCAFLADWCAQRGARLLVETLPHTAAQGPCYARERIECAIRADLEARETCADEALVLMVDAHTLFAPRWDELLRAEFARHPPNAVLTCYPKSFARRGRGEPLWTHDPRPVALALNRWNELGVPMFKYVFCKRPIEEPTLSQGLGACMLAVRAGALYEVPYARDVPFLFIGEETFMWFRYLEAGYDVYVPWRDIVQTTFDRRGRGNFSRQTSLSAPRRAIQERSVRRVVDYMTRGGGARARIEARPRELVWRYIQLILREKPVVCAREWWARHPELRAPAGRFPSENKK